MRGLELRVGIRVSGFSVWLLPIGAKQQGVGRRCTGGAKGEGGGGCERAIGRLQP